MLANIIKNSSKGLGEAESEGKKCGFICKLAKRALMYVFDKASSSLGAEINVLAPGWIQRQRQRLEEWSSSWNFRTMPQSDDTPTDKPITETEENILENWFITYIEPLSKLIIDNIVALKNASNSDKANGYNAALTTMCLLQKYASQTTVGLSQNAITNRVNTLNEVFNPLKLIIFSQIPGWSIKNNTVNLNQLQASAFGLNPMSGTVSCQLVELTPKTAGTADPNSQFVGQDGQIKSVKDSVNLDLVADTTLSANPASNASTDIIKDLKPSWWQNWMFIPLAFVGYKIVK